MELMFKNMKLVLGIYFTVFNLILDRKHQSILSQRDLI